MLRALLAALLLAPALAAAQAPDSLRLLPAFGIPVTGDFRPPQTSAARAYLYSATATGALVGVGYLLYEHGPQPDPTLASTAYVREAGGLLMILGVMAGPMAGNLSLGAGRDAGHGVRFKAAGAIGGSVLLGVALVSAGVCLGSGAQSGTCPLEPVAVGAFYGIPVVIGAGLAVGAVYDLATIPANARWARQARATGNRVPAREVRVQIAPGYDPRFDAPMGTVRITM